MLLVSNCSISNINTIKSNIEDVRFYTFSNNESRSTLYPYYTFKCYEEIYPIMYNYIFNNDKVFIEFMENIIIPMQDAKNVCILYSDMSDICPYNESNVIIEIFTSIIKNRYGYISTEIKDIDDIIGLKYDNDSLQLYNRMNLSSDIEKYNFLIERR